MAPTQTPPPSENREWAGVDVKRELSSDATPPPPVDPPPPPPPADPPADLTPPPLD